MNDTEIISSLKDAAVIAELHNSPINVVMSINKVIEMLTPKHPTGYYSYYRCPTCGRRVRRVQIKDKRCQDCGQVLNWEGLE